MLSPGGARGVKKAELNGNVDSDYDHGGSSRTYVLHRARCSQEDDQLLRQGCERSGAAGRQGWGDTLGTRRLDENASATLDSGDGSHDFHRLDLRSSASSRAAGEGSASADAARHRCGRQIRFGRGARGINSWVLGSVLRNFLVQSDTLTTQSMYVWSLTPVLINVNDRSRNFSLVIPISNSEAIRPDVERIT